MAGSLGVGMSVQVVPCGRSALVVVTGELDLTTAALLDAALEPLLRASRRPRLSRLVVDLSRVPFADVVGLNPLLLARAVLARRRGGVELRGARGPVVRVLDLLGMGVCVVPAAARLPGQPTGYGDRSCASSSPAARSTTSDA